MPRRFPPPWSVEELDACFVVRDHNGQALAYVYYEDEPGRLNTMAMSRRRFATVVLSSSLKPRAAAGSLQRPPSRAVH
jgi:hypothetical protein